MSAAFSTFIALFAMSGVFSILLALYASFHKTRFTGMSLFVWMSAATAVYTFGSALELASSSLESIKFWIAFEYLGLPFISPLNLLVVFHYIGRERMMTPRAAAAMLAIPAMTSLLMLTNDLHGLVYQSIGLREDVPWILADFKMGVWYVVNGSYTLGCGVVGMWLLALHMRRTLNVYRKQTAVMFIGLFVPIFTSLIYTVNLTPHHIDPVPATMSLTNLLYCWAIFSAGMLTSTPIVRENILESMRDGVLILDPAGRLADYNKAASRMFPFLKPDLIGAGAADAFPKRHLRPEDADMAFLEAEDRQIEWVDGHEVRYYRIRSSPVYNRKGGAMAGRTVVVLDVTESVLLHRKLEKMATHDGMTQIYNRTHFVERTEKLILEAWQAGEPLTLALFDIDRFKSINDTYGHDVGDLVIRHVVHACKIYLGDRDVFGRYGGEEFALCMPGRTVENAYALLESVRRELASGPVSTSAGPVGVTASFGLVEARPGRPLKRLTKLADDALYRAKQGGRNNVQLAAGERLEEEDEAEPDLKKGAAGA
ncbi:histidine kinase N-terminal 7TM domain-containing diguanylate cyclase [Saccharibacillus alkalitolerans]|uniref:Diguanylate cyclase n=1 Tax=Saccharibacillus alkalitolerans TaxID=2705290 RepID=A0ABX0F5Q4_9BACL|nr:histidine kinase N-terminal 7TM domain-containing protein [Saccharibacillus alkalitolerans]NGZ76276.1 diguanylate cyclase [Saccharibacillus alkalitolerans]